MNVGWVLIGVEACMVMALLGMAYFLRQPDVQPLVPAPVEPKLKFSDRYPLKKHKEPQEVAVQSEGKGKGKGEVEGKGKGKGKGKVEETENQNQNQVEVQVQVQVQETEANRELRQVEEDDVPDTGKVVLRNLGVGEFEYWSDRSVSYPDLEAMARKWVLVFMHNRDDKDDKDDKGNADVYLERKRVVEAPAAPAAPAAKRFVEDENAVTFSVFAPLKTYAPAKAVVLEQANVYRWRGKVRDLPVKAKPEEPTLRYSDYKKNV